MKVLIDIFDSADDNIRRQQCVYSALNRTDIHFIPCLEMCDLAACMHTGVCPASSCNAELILEEIPKGLLEHALNRTTVRLILPSRVFRSIVFNRQPDCSHKQKIPPHSGTPVDWSFSCQNVLVSLTATP